MNRERMLQDATDASRTWDFVIIGGGATGVGTALDAASRGYAVLLLEQSDFGKGTSSRSTKLIHGGVRYLRQGNIKLVVEALKERATLRKNAPHLVHDLPFVLPAYRWWEKPFYGLGMKVYDLLAGRHGFGSSSRLSLAAAKELVPTLAADGLRGGVCYHDGQFDDARLLINLVQTATEQGATLLNYCPVAALTRNAGGSVSGVVAQDAETGEEFTVTARCVINATGAFADGVRALDDPGAEAMIAASQGIHVVVERSFLPGEAALVVPRTRDGRLMFAIPWHDHVLLGTTDTPIDDVVLEPRPLDAEIDFVLETAAGYLNPAPTRDDVLSMFAGIRPLVKAGRATDTSVISREHSIVKSDSGLLTIAGGKWTTYRKMAQDCVDEAAAAAGLEARPCVTHELTIHGYDREAQQFGELAAYGSDAPSLQELMDADAALAERLHARVPLRAGQVVWAARHEMARTVDDVLARRSRVLLLDAQAAIELAEPVARLLAAELGRDERWVAAQVQSFGDLADGYLP